MSVYLWKKKDRSSVTLSIPNNCLVSGPSICSRIDRSSLVTKARILFSLGAQFLTPLGSVGIVTSVRASIRQGLANAIANSLWIEGIAFIGRRDVKAKHTHSCNKNGPSKCLHGGDVCWGVNDCVQCVPNRTEPNGALARKTKENDGTKTK